MDISPKTLREVEFREKFRGYHPEDVDTFLEQVAVGVETLQTQLRQATERAAHAEQLANAAGTSDEAVGRTLLLAQRTADVAVEEAREQAARIVSAAEEQATQTVSGAEEQGRTIVEEANQRAQRISEESQAALREQLAALEDARQQLQRDVDVLQEWIDQHRSRVASSLQDLLNQVDQNLVVHAPPPALSDVTIPAAPVPAAEPPTAADVAAADDELADDELDEVDDLDEGDDDWEDEGEGDLVDDELDEAGDDEGAEDDELPEEAAVAGAPSATDDEPPEATEAAASTSGDDDDPFMAELRRAVTDTEPLGPRAEDDVPAATDQALEHDFDTSRRFGPRLRRKR